jgi:hypothetical protein
MKPTAATRCAAWVLLVVLAAWGARVGAHHSIGATYDVVERVSVEGVVTKFVFVNPHPFLLLEVRDRGGLAHAWRLELDSFGDLAAVGFGPATLKPGDRIVVLGSPAKRRPLSLYVRRLERPADGFIYQPDL